MVQKGFTRGFFWDKLSHPCSQIIAVYISVSSCSNMSRSSVQNRSSNEVPTWTFETRLKFSSKFSTFAEPDLKFSSGFSRIKWVWTGFEPTAVSPLFFPFFQKNSAHKRPWNVMAYVTVLVILMGQIPAVPGFHLGENIHKNVYPS